jgi:hypothetical protein
MTISLAEPTEAVRSRRQDRIARVVIIGSGLLVLAMLAWVHLGVGALIFPPAANPTRQVAAAGTYQVALETGSGDLLVGDHNTIALVVTDAAQNAIKGARIAVAAEMLTMPMPVPNVSATEANGRYMAHPIFSMAGPWQLTVTITAPGQAQVHATFKIGVRWHA